MNIKFSGTSFPVMAEMGADGGDAGGAGVSSTSEGGLDAGGESDFNLDSLMDSDNDMDFGGGEEPPKEPEPAPVAPVVPTEPAPVQPTAPEPAPVVTAPSAAEPQPAVHPDVQREQARATAYTGLVSSWQQQLSPEVVEQIMTDPVTMLPQLMAQVELRTLETAMQQVMAQIPNVINGMVAQQQNATTTADLFFSEFPNLVDVEADVAATFEQFKGLPGFDFSNKAHRAQVAGAVMAAKGMWQQPVQPTQPAAPAARPTMRPAGSSAALAQAPAPSQTNIWESMIGDDD